MAIPASWEPGCALAASIITLPIASSILYKERQKRRLNDTKFASQRLADLSKICMLLGFIFPIIHPLGYIHHIAEYHICSWTLSLVTIVLIAQGLFMDYFQIARLYYCFSQENAHSVHGYPRWLYIIMFYAVTICAITASVSWTIMTSRTDCENHDGSTVGGFQSLTEHVDHMILSISVLFFYILDAILLYLYWHQANAVMRMHRHEFAILKQNEEINEFQNLRTNQIQENIQLILWRVVILSLLYKFITFFMIFMSRSFRSFISLSYSLSMYLMLDHNTAEYITFMRWFTRFQLHWCCCCCAPMVSRHYQILNIEPEAAKVVLDDSPKVNDDMISLQAAASLCTVYFYKFSLACH